MSRQNQRSQRALPPKKDEKDDDVILGEIVNTPPLVTSHIVEIYVKDNKENELQKLLDAEVEYNRKRFEVIREHLEKHPDGIENRKNKVFRRIQYGVLIGVLCLLLLSLPFIPLSATAVFGIICILIVSGVLVNARERELDLSGLVKLFTAIAGRKDK